MRNKNIALRLASMFLDHVIMTFGIVLTFLFIGGTGYFISESIFTSESPDFLGIIMMLLGLLLFSIYFNKDAIKGRSPGKRILGFVVVENETGKIVNPIKSFIRNLTIVVWPVEVVFSIFSPDRRIEDYLAGTKIITDNRSLTTEVKPLQVLIALVLGIIFLFSLFATQLPIIGGNPN